MARSTDIRCGALPPQIQKNPRDVEATRGFSGSDRRRSGDLSIFSRTLYQLSYRAARRAIAASDTKGLLRKEGPSLGATLTGLEPATSAVTGRHANQLRYRARCA